MDGSRSLERERGNHKWNRTEVRSSESLKDKMNRILVGPLLKTFRNKSIVGGEKTGRGLIGVPWFVSDYACRRQGRWEGWTKGEV
jgi:hypothetical protein